MGELPVIRNVVFDLDGTLTKSDSTIYKCTVKTLKEFDVVCELPEDQFNLKIGHHFKDIFDDFKIQMPDIENFIDQYKLNYFDFIHESAVYPNVEKVLDYLQKNNYYISLLTTKSQDQSEKILEHFGLSSYFNVIMGRRIEFPVKPAPDALIYICNVLGLQPENTMMVGDSELDIRCGKNAGTFTCGVTYGYRNRQSLVAEKPDYLISDIKELINIITHHYE